MKIHFFLLISVVSLSASKTNTIPTSLTLQEAISKKLVTYKASSNGNYSGGSVVFKLTNLVSQPISIVVPNCSYFEPENSEDQNLLIVKDVPIALAAKETKAMVLDGYCMESHDRSPTTNSKMTLRTTKNNKLTQLCKYLNSHHNSRNDAQSAVWAAADNQPLYYIDNIRPEPQALRTEVATITQQTNPWFSSVPIHNITPTRLIETNPVTVKGLMKIQIASADKIHEVIKTKNGEVKYTTPKFGFPRAGDWTYTFNLEVKGWEKGEYTIDVLQGLKTIKTIKFSV